MDPSIRATLKIDWLNAVVIFDEAHNLESVASDASSFSLSSVDIAACISEMQQVIRVLQTSGEGTGDQVKDQAGRDEKQASSGTGGSNRPNMDRCVSILSALFQLENRLDQVPLGALPQMDAVGKVLPGGWLIELFDSAGFKIELVSRDICDVQCFISKLIFRS